MSPYPPSLHDRLCRAKQQQLRNTLQHNDTPSTSSQTKSCLPLVSYTTHRPRLTQPTACSGCHHALDTQISCWNALRGASQGLTYPSTSITKYYTNHITNNQSRSHHEPIRSTQTTTAQQHTGSTTQPHDLSPHIPVQ